ncbi:hypothetical protein BDY19DRAFT_994069 [Irpex rosettiformis]|uniref:Uncharacterized protein n=1 Tax=Irpex rosettiformis TaxID=378272 RepID=A0ACB8U416_9APHY|nr:hypothetical protein BDY19DRAFT_994069 [Irpex rosettiformis]
MDAPKLTLPTEVCSQVVQYAYPSDLPALGRTSKAFQVLAETRIYVHITMKDDASLRRIGTALLSRDHVRSSYVRRLWVYQDPRISRGPWSEGHWRVIQNILPKLVNLESTYIFDEAYVNTWIFDTNQIRFQLREATFGFNWDNALVNFLEGQHELRILCIQAPDEDDNTRRTLAPGSLQKLESFDGPLFVATDLITSPLRRLCIRVDEENAPLFSAYITEFARTNKTLSSLNVLHVPEYLVADSLHVLALSPVSGSLRYLGILNLPVSERYDIHRSLLKFERLEVIQMDVSHWNPPAMILHFAMLATELRTYCFTLRCVVIWVNTQQWLGRCENDHWVFQQLPGQHHPTRDNQWRDY